VPELLTHEHIDMAYSYSPHYEGLSHAFLNGVMYLDTERKRLALSAGGHGHQLHGSRVNVNRAGSIPSARSASEADLDPPSPRPIAAWKWAPPSRVRWRAARGGRARGLVELVACLPGPKHTSSIPTSTMTCRLLRGARARATSTPGARSRKRRS